MLVLSVRVREKIVLPGLQTSVQLVSAQSGSARLGIDAPRNVPIYRQELLPLKAGEGSSPPPPSAVSPS